MIRLYCYIYVNKSTKLKEIQYSLQLNLRQSSLM